MISKGHILCDSIHVTFLIKSQSWTTGDWLAEVGDWLEQQCEHPGVRYPAASERGSELPGAALVTSWAHSGHTRVTGGTEHAHINTDFLVWTLHYVLARQRAGARHLPGRFSTSSYKYTMISKLKVTNTKAWPRKPSGPTQTYALRVATRQRHVPSRVRKFLCLKPPSIRSHTYCRGQR